VPLTCYCGDDSDWYYDDDDFVVLETKRGRRCASCGTWIRPGETALRFSCWRDPRSDYEWDRFGEEVAMADKFMCEPCGDQYMNLTALGFCITLGLDNMMDLLQEYREVYVPMARAAEKRR